MIEGVVAGLVANRIGDTAKVATERGRKKSREDRITEELGPVETEFSDALGANIESRATELDSVALFNIASNWEVIFEQINAYEVAFDSEEAAVDWLVEAILDCEDVDVSLDDDEQAELRQLVAEAYADAVEEFRDAVAADEELANRFQFDVQTELLDQFEVIAEAFERIADQRSYRLYEFPAERDEIVDAVEVNRVVEFVPRPDLVPAETSVNRQLVLGPSGSGKSRVIAERLARLPDDAVEHVLVPEDQMLDTADARALEREPFDGDLLLVWEDLHRVDGGREDGVVRNVLRRLDAALDEQGHRFRALLEAQSGRLEDVFGQLPADFENEKSLWHTFEPLWMGELDADGRGLLAERMAAKYEVELGDAARDRLVERTADSESAPVYVEAVFETASDELTEADVAELPEKVAHIWDRQYRHLREESDAEWQVLAAMKYLYDLRVPRFSKLVYEVFCEHLNAERERFRTAVESLANRRQWLTVDGDDLVSEATRYRVHDTKLEPIGVRARDDADDLSDLLLASVADDVPDDARAPIHFNSGVSYHDSDEYELAADHYEQALAINPQGAKTHNNYALVKRALGNPQAAADHFEQALTIEPELAKAHVNYALLLKEELGDPPAAADHFEQALTIEPDYAEAHNNYALLLKEELGNTEAAADHYERALTIDPQFAEAHMNYAGLVRKDRDDPKAATDHYEQALAIDPELAEAHMNYALFLEEELGNLEAATDHYEQALTIDPELAKAHFNYGKFLYNKLNNTEVAAEHYQQALSIDPDYTQVHFNYAILLRYEFGKAKAAAKHYEQALANDSENADYHYQYALLLQKELDQPKFAAEHYEEALTVDSENAEIHYNYATLLIEELNELELAADHLQQALTIDPEFVIAHINYANILQEELDDLEAAADHYERALKIDPEIAEAHYSYAVLLENELDDLKTAADHYERALEIWLEGDDQESDSQAVERMPQIVQLFEEVGRSETAVEFCRRGLEVCDQPWVSLGTEKGIRGEQARLSARDDSDRVPELYWYGLDDLREGYPDVATELLTEAWSLREAVNGDPVTDALAAGVWCVYLPDADIMGDPIERAADADLSDRPIVAALVTTRTSDDPPPTPVEYRSRGISGHYGHEINAWEALLRRT